jgi:hypothetical protein
MRLAARMSCRYVVLCSRSAVAEEVVRLAQSVPGLRYAVVSVPRGYRHDLLAFDTDDIRPSLTGGLGDLSLKRNLGLLFGHWSGWRSILFLDDDIRQLSPRTVDRALSALQPGGAVGMPATAYPDNSVICHANRRSGGPQGVFVSGSALAVDCTEITSYFPDVYNEDWLFLAPRVAQGGVFSVGWSSQLRYDPFGNPQRAASEEFGDVLAEGLMGLFHVTDNLDSGAGDAYWEEFLLRRKEFIADIRARTSPRHTKVLDALAAAERQRTGITATDLADYVVTWEIDRLVWRERLELLGRELPFRNALKKLGLVDRAVVAEGFDRGRLTAEPSTALPEVVKEPVPALAGTAA